MADTSEPEEIVRDCFAWSNGDFSKTDVMAESIDVYNPGLPGGETHDRDVWEDYLHKLHDGFSDIHFEIQAMASSADMVMVEYRVVGTHDGEFQGLPPTNREIELWAVDKFLITNGQVEEWESYYDTAELQDQLGMTFPTVIGQLPKLALGKLRSIS